MACQSRGDQIFKKNKPPNATKAESQTPTNSLHVFFVVIKVQRWFEKL